MGFWRVCIEDTFDNKRFKGILKIYPLRLQAYIWCWTHDYVYRAGRYGYVLDDRISIEEVE